METKSHIKEGGPSFAKASTSGQVMVITVLVLSVTALAAGVIATLLTVTQLRQVRGLADSTKAIYAADSGVEYELYRAFVDGSYVFTFPQNSDGAYPLQNESQFTTTAENSRIRSLGQFRDAFRAFSVTF